MFGDFWDVFLFVMLWLMVIIGYVYGLGVIRIFILDYLVNVINYLEGIVLFSVSYVLKFCYIDIFIVFNGMFDLMLGGWIL